MSLILAWSFPLGAYFGALGGAGIGFAIKTYRTQGVSKKFWFFIGLMLIGNGLSIAHVYNCRQYDNAVYAAVATEFVQNADKRFIQYKGALASEGTLPTERPLTRAELIEFYRTEFPLAFEQHARLGVQASRNIFMQVFNPFFTFKDDAERAEYAIKYLELNGVYENEYPEYTPTEIHAA